RLPDALISIDFRLDALLTLLGGLEPTVADNLASEGRATVIEWPDRLLLVPNPITRLAHRAKPFTSPATGVTELWHTTLQALPTGASPDFRAIENRSDTAARPFIGTLTKQNRDDIVEHSLRSGGEHVIASSLFRLSALGATAGLKSNWPFD